MSIIDLQEVRNLHRHDSVVQSVRLYAEAREYNCANVLSHAEKLMSCVYRFILKVTLVK